MFNILITCPPMIKQIDRYKDKFSEMSIYYPVFEQTLSEDELINLVPQYDGWIIGDDPATRRVLEAGKAGKLKACVKWGVGVDNVDFDACKDLDIPISNTPAMFGEEVSDIAIGYMIGLARDLFRLDAGVKAGTWPKPTGISLFGKKVCVVGFGDIGRCTVKKLLAFNMDIWAVDPGFVKYNNQIVCVYNKDLEVPDMFNNINLDTLEACMIDAEFVIVACALNNATRHMINKDILSLTKKGLRLINVSRGPVVVENDVVELQESGHIHSIAFDVFEVEPLSRTSGLRKFDQNIFGSHNGSNTIEAVDKTSNKTISLISYYLKSN